MKFISLPWACKTHGSHERYYTSRGILVAYKNRDLPGQSIIVRNDNTADPIALDLPSIHALFPELKLFTCRTTDGLDEPVLVNPHWVISIHPSEEDPATAWVDLGAGIAFRVVHPSLVVLNLLNGVLN